MSAPIANPPQPPPLPGDMGLPEDMSEFFLNGLVDGFAHSPSKETP